MAKKKTSAKGSAAAKDASTKKKPASSPKPASSLPRLGRSYLRDGPETMEEVLVRAASWLRAADAAGLGAEVLDRLEGRQFRPQAKIENLKKFLALFETERAFATPKPSAALEEQLVALEKRSGAALPSSLVELWTARRENPHVRALLDTVIAVSLYDPADYLSLPAWAEGHRLAVAKSGPNSIHPVYRTLLDGYLEPYEGMKATLRLPREGSEKANAEWRKLGAYDGRMLDPSFSDALIPVAIIYGEWRMLVSDLRDARGEAPVFQGGDDFHGFAFKIGRDCADWLGWELDTTIREVCELNSR